MWLLNKITMLNPRADSIIYQAQIYYRDLVNSLVTSKHLGKALDAKWDKADQILAYLEALNYRGRLTEAEDITNVNYILECLIKLCELNQYPIAAPITFQEPPAVIVGVKGETGDDGATGAKGDTGLATDFQISLISIPTVVDSFNINDAKGARWDYVLVKSTGEQRSGSIIGTWNASGSEIKYFDDSTDDILGSTASLSFNVQLSGPNITLVAIPLSGQWAVFGSRYFIPNNGNGSGPISDVLTNGKIYIGNASNVATEQTVTGVISMTNTGVTSLNSGVVSNVHIANGAAIAVNKLAAITGSRIVITDVSGFLTTTASPTLTELGYVGGVTSPIQTQLNTKLTDPMTTVGDIIIRNGSNVTARLGAGSPGQVLTMSGGIPSWQTPVAGFSDPMTTIGDIIIRNAGNTTVRLGAGSPGQFLGLSGGVPSWQNVPSGFADPMTSIGDIMIRNGSNVTTRLGIGTSGQVLSVSGGVPTWSTLTNMITGSLVAGRVTLSAGTNSVTDDSDFTFTSAGNILGLTSGEFTSYGTAMLITTQSGNQTISLKPHGTGAIQLQALSLIKLGNPLATGGITLQIDALTTNADLILLPKASGSGSGIAGTGTVLMPSVGIGVGQPFKVGASGNVQADGGYGRVYVPVSGPTEYRYYQKKTIVRTIDLTAGLGIDSFAHGLTRANITNVYCVAFDSGSNMTSSVANTQRINISESSGSIFLGWSPAAFGATWTAATVKVTIEYQV